jgi:hypothetical protein
MLGLQAYTITLSQSILFYLFLNVFLMALEFELSASHLLGT